MSELWYYRNGNKVIGPIKLMELSWLARQGSISTSTHIRRGKGGEWVPSAAVEELTASIQELPTPEQSGATKWFFTQGQRRLGPVSFASLKKLASSGKLKSEDLCWNQEMAEWQPVERIPGLMGGPVPPLPVTGEASSRSFAEAPARLKIVLAGLVALMIGGIVLWTVNRATAMRHRRNVGKVAGTRLPDPKEVASSERQNPVGPGNPPVAEETLDDPRLADAVGAIRAGQLGRAHDLLDRYVVDPTAKRKDRGLKMRGELDLSGSTENAAKLAKEMTDKELDEHLRDEAKSLAAKLDVGELRSVYQNTLMKAMRQERSRRQMIPRDRIAQQPKFGGEEADGKQPPRPDVKKPVPPGRKSLVDAVPKEQAPGLGDDPLVAEGPDVRGLPSESANLDQVIESPQKYRGRAVPLSGLFKIGTRESEVKNDKGDVVGLSIPVARYDGRTICRGDRKIEASGLYLILDKSTAQVLKRALLELNLRPTPRPDYRAILEVSLLELPRANGLECAIVIETIEILGWCDYLRIARREFKEAFRVVEVTPAGGYAGPGDGSKWVERLGGETGFVQPIRKKLRDLQRRFATNAEPEQFNSESDFRRELRRSIEALSIGAAIQALNGAGVRRPIGR
jgi:hypothetical protein